jgi:RNA polymerase sigma factor (sigma-70 family)
MDADVTQSPRPDWFDPSMRRRLVAFARRFVGDGHEAEDVVQETLLRASEGRGRLREGDRAEAWLFRICRHAAIDHVRSRRVRRSVWCAMPDEAEDWILEREKGHSGPSGEGSEGRASLDAEAATRPRGAPALQAGPLKGLPAHHRLLLELHYHRGLGQPLLCRRSGLTASALRVRLFRARRRLLPDLAG